MKREAYVDNAKVVLIFLVVFGHLIQPLKQEIEAVDAMYQWIFLFHMPAFILVSGFFAKGIGDTDYIKKIAKRILVPYMIFQVLYSGYYMMIGKNDWQSSFFDPNWGLWFLLSLFSWHMLLIGFKRLTPITGIALAFGIGLLVGYLP
ncbi:acyltransferase family protein [Gracilibacillus halophilus]|uniref:acyltransferase family protein n=1 Tax=Gracilibacillus halophilus TaxID=470864 RepID=UPI0003A8902C|nr:acyltransferase family protein [Gracilibacillus halophilus]